MKEHPDRFIGTVILNPKYQKESLEEIDRCRDAGMIGLGELYNQVKINDPLYYPIIEKCIDINWNIMMHSPIGYSRVTLNPNEPKNISLPEDFADIAGRYPEAMFQFAHIAGGIDWEYACKVLKDYPNVFVETAGSNNEANMIDFAMKYIGEDRLVFGCDYGFYQGVGHIFSAKLTDAQRKKIFFENISKRLKKGGLDVN
jgi:predicted TIM-barrel fold metal-dependent hydrolase